MPKETLDRVENLSKMMGSQKYSRMINSFDILLQSVFHPFAIFYNPWKERYSRVNSDRTFGLLSLPYAT